MDTIIFIETNKSGSSREGIKAAEEMGYYTVLFTSKKRFVKQREEFPDVHKLIYLPSITLHHIKKRITNLRGYGNEIKAVISFIDNYVHIAARLSNEFSSSIVSVKAIEAMEDKTKTYQMLKDHESTPTSLICNDMDEILAALRTEIIQLPFIVKNPSSTGSKDVFLIQKEDEIKYIVRQLLNKYPGQSMLVEEFIEGPQYLIEAVVYEGHLEFIAVFEQEIEYKDRFIIVGYHYLKEMTSKFLAPLQKSIESIMTDLRITNGNFHLEMRFCNGNWKLIEVNPRISGGAMNQMIQVATGVNLAKETIRLYMGEKPLVNATKLQHTYTKYLTVNKAGKIIKVTGKKRAENRPFVKHVYIKPRKGQFVQPPKSMGHRYAYVIATGETYVEAKKNAIQAAGEIEFHIQPLEKGRQDEND